MYAIASSSHDSPMIDGNEEPNSEHSNNKRFEDDRQEVTYNGVGQGHDAEFNYPTTQQWTDQNYGIERHSDQHDAHHRNDNTHDNDVDYLSNENVYYHHDGEGEMQAQGENMADERSPHDYSPISSTSSSLSSQDYQNTRERNAIAERAASVFGSTVGGQGVTSYNPFPRAQPPSQQAKARSRLPQKVHGYHGDFDTPGPGSYMPPDSWNKKSFSTSASMGKASGSRQRTYCAS